MPPRSYCQVRPVLPDEADHAAQRRIVTEVDTFLNRNGERLTNGGKGFGLLDRVDAEIRFQIQVEVQHVLGIAGLLGHDTQDLLDHLVSGRQLRLARRQEPTLGPKLQQVLPGRHSRPGQGGSS